MGEGDVRRIEVSVFMCVCVCVCMSVRYWKKAEFNDFVHMFVCKVAVSRSRCTLWVFLQVASEKRPKDEDADIDEYCVDEGDVQRVKVSAFMCMCVSVCLSDIGRRPNLMISYVCLSVRWVSRVYLVFVSRCDRARC